MNNIKAGESALKNCPFCGAGWKLVQTIVDFRKGIFEEAWYVNCNTGCNARTTNWHTRQQAIDAWNKRVEVKTADKTLSTPLPDVNECVEWNIEELKKICMFSINGRYAGRNVWELVFEEIANSKSILKWKKGE